MPLNDPSRPRTVFITGATGFVGSHTARLFLREGWRVRALVRRPDRPGLLPTGMEVVAGDLLEPKRYRGRWRGATQSFTSRGG